MPKPKRQDAGPHGSFHTALEQLDRNLLDAEGVKAMNRCSAVDELWAALKVLTLDPKIRAWLKVNDPKALDQADRAVRKADQGGDS